MNRTLSGRLYWGQALATRLVGQTNVDLVAAPAPGVLSASDTTASFRLQPEFVQWDGPVWPDLADNNMRSVT